LKSVGICTHLNSIDSFICIQVRLNFIDTFVGVVLNPTDTTVDTLNTFMPY